MPVTFGSSGNRDVTGITMGNGGNRNVIEGWIGTNAGNKKFFQAFEGQTLEYTGGDPGPGSVNVPQGARHLTIHAYGSGARGEAAVNEDSA